MSARPGSPSHRRAAGVAASLIGFAAVVSLTGGHATAATPSSSTTSFVTMVSPSGESVGNGTSRFWVAPRDSITHELSSEANTLQVDVSGAGGDFTLQFEAPVGKQLRPGTYSDSSDTPSKGLPGLHVFGEGRGCATDHSTFWVRDIDPAVGRVWIDYEQHCQGGQPALTGEVRLGYPGSGGIEAAPADVQWPADYPGVPLRPVPVHLLNTGTSTVGVVGASIATGASDFDVEANACTTLSPGATCSVFVGFTPSRPGTRAGLLRVDSWDGTTWIPLSGSGIAGQSYWTMSSPPGDFVGGGLDYSYRPTTGATITAGGSETHAWASVVAGDDRWNANFEPAPGRILLPGTTFSDATRYPFNAGAGIDISGNGRGCNTETGSFTVDEATYDDNGNLTSYRIDFAQQCEGFMPALTGTIAWRADDPAAPPLDTTPPGRATITSSHSGRRGVDDLAWTNPGGDWARTIVRALPGRTAPSGADQGVAVYTGGDTSIETVLAPIPAGWTVGVFAQDTSGNVSDVSSVWLRPFEQVSLHTAPRQVVAGDLVTLTGRVVVDGTSAGIPRRTMHLDISHAGEPPHRGPTFVTGPHGGFRVRVTLDRSSTVTVSDAFSGRTVKVPVASRVNLRVAAGHPRPGPTVGLHLSVHPGLPGANVLLQARDHGHWRQVRSAVLDRHGQHTFVVRAGLHRTVYRALVPGTRQNTTGTSAPVTVAARG